MNHAASIRTQNQNDRLAPPSYGVQAPLDRPDQVDIDAFKKSLSTTNINNTNADNSSNGGTLESQFKQQLILGVVSNIKRSSESFKHNMEEINRD